MLVDNIASCMLQIHPSEINITKFNVTRGILTYPVLEHLCILKSVSQG